MADVSGNSPKLTMAEWKARRAARFAERGIGAEALAVWEEKHKAEVRAEEAKRLERRAKRLGRPLAKKAVAKVDATAKRNTVHKA
tara:strand:+ start:242 stop:496 length:255 start_codon:yes stop_codon:yes gene_type:complete